MGRRGRGGAHSFVCADPGIVPLSLTLIIHGSWLKTIWNVYGADIYECVKFSADQKFIPLLLLLEEVVAVVVVVVVAVVLVVVVAVVLVVVVSHFLELVSELESGYFWVV